MKRKAIYIFVLGLSVLLSGSCKKQELGNPLPSTVADFSETLSNNSYAPCEVVFENKSVNASGYLWDFGNGETSTEENPTVQYSTPGLYTVTLTCKAQNEVYYNKLVKSKVINIKDITAGFTRVLYYTTRTSGLAGIYLVVLNDEAPLIQEFEPTDYLTRPYGIAVDSVNSKVYVTDWSAECIYRFDADGKNPVKILDSNVPGQEIIADAQGIFIEGDKVYWGQSGGIFKANLDGSNPEEHIPTGSTGIEYPLDMNYDRESGTIYLCNDKEAYSGSVYGASMDGSVITQIIPDVDVTAMDADFRSGTLYLAGYASEGTVIEDFGIYSCKLDGSGLVKIGEYGDKATWGVALDPKANKLFWSFKNSNNDPNGKIVRANLDGTDAEDFIVDVNPVAMTIAWVKL